jgi:hypothetical protein
MLRTKTPNVFPRTVRTAIVLPHEIARAIVKSTLGPGIKIIAIAEIMYGNTCCGAIINFSLGSSLKEHLAKTPCRDTYKDIWK